MSCVAVSLVKAVFVPPLYQLMTEHWVVVVICLCNREGKVIIVVLQWGSFVERQWPSSWYEEKSAEPLLLLLLLDSSSCELTLAE